MSTEEAKEREIKLIADDGFQLPSLVGTTTGVARVVQRSPQRLDAVYFDTPNLALLSLGITVRHRSGETDAPVWTIKLPVSGDKTLRKEVTFPAEGSEPPAEIAALLRSVLGRDAVRPAVEVRTQRARWLLVDPYGTPLAELSDDHVEVVDGAETRAHFREIEVEARGADIEGLKRIARQIRKAGARREQVPKVKRALEAIRSGSTRPAELDVRPDDPVRDAVRVAISELTRNMVAEAPHALLGDPVGVHQMRVKQRHLRSILRAFGPILDKDKLALFVEELRWLGVLLGNVRDLDVFGAHLRENAGEAEALSPLLRDIEAQVSIARVQLQEGLGSDRYMDLISTSRELIADPGFVLADGSCQEELPPLAAKAADRLRKAARALGPESAESDFHEVRKLAKRARYTALTVAGFVKPKQRSILTHFAVSVATVQDVFGEHHDAAVARDRLLALARGDFASDGAMNLRIGQLVERADQRASKLGRMCLRMWHELDEDIGKAWPKA